KYNAKTFQSGKPEINTVCSIGLLGGRFVQVGQRDLLGGVLTEHPERVADNSVVLCGDAVSITKDEGSGFGWWYHRDLCMLWGRRRCLALLLVAQFLDLIRQPLHFHRELGAAAVVIAHDLLGLRLGIKIGVERIEERIAKRIDEPGIRKEELVATGEVYAVVKEEAVAAKVSVIKVSVIKMPIAYEHCRTRNCPRPSRHGCVHPISDHAHARHAHARRSSK